MAAGLFHFGMRDMFLMSFSLDHRFSLRDEPRPRGENDTHTQRKEGGGRASSHIHINIFDSSGHELSFLKSAKDLELLGFGGT
jgi:hypothetical protein